MYSSEKEREKPEITPQKKGREIPNEIPKEVPEIGQKEMPDELNHEPSNPENPKSAIR